MSIQNQVNFISSETNVFGVLADEIREITFMQICDALKNSPDTVVMFRQAKKRVLAAASECKLKVDVSFEKASAEELRLLVNLLLLQGFKVAEIGLSKVYTVMWGEK